MGIKTKNMKLKRILVKIWRYLWNDDKTEKTIGKLSMNEEKAIKNIVENLLRKKDVIVSMAPNSERYFIIHKEIGVNILINGNSHVVKISNHNWKYAWNFTDSFIKNLIESVIDKIEADRLILEQEIFENEILLIKKINGLVDSLENSEKKEENILLV